MVTNIQKDALLVFHEHDVASLEGVTAGEADDIWLRVRRLRESSPPPLERMFDGWVSNLNSPTEPPRFADHHMVSVSLETASDLLEAGLAVADDVMPQRGEKADPLLVDVILRTENMPEFVEAFQNWCAGPWTQWAIVERPRRQSIAFYNRLFEVYQRMVASGDDAPVECVYGVGIARWEHPRGRIDAPLIEWMVELGIDEADGSVVVRPRQQSPRLSLRAFDERGVQGIGRVQNQASDQLRRVVEDEDLGPLSPFNKFAFVPILRTCQARLAPDAIYVPDEREAANDRSVPKAAAQLRVTDTWVLYVRQRSVDFRCDDIRRLKGLIEETGDDALLPPPGIQLTSRPSDIRIEEDKIDLNDDSALNFPEGPKQARIPHSESENYANGLYAASEQSDSQVLWLPLPFNDEQAEIIRKLEQPDACGVVVQGPPGTGKTHTIANIVCHYMARGRRVLVSARTPEALTALHAKLPEAVRDLAISVIHSDQEGGRQLERAVDILACQVAHIDKAAFNRERLDKEHRLGLVRQEIVSLDRAIRDYAAQNLRPVVFRGVDLLPMDLATKVEKERAACSWLEDKLDFDTRFEPRFSDAEVSEARSIRARLALQLQFVENSDSLAHHDSLRGSWDVGSFDRDDVGVMGVVAA